jgi:hydroxymethylbilane synthase
VALIATRRSRLALVQAEAAREALGRAHPEASFELLPVATAGDRLADRSLEEVEGRGFFTDALEDALARGEAALAVHSLKDMPTELPPGLAIAAVLPRADPRDALVSRHGGLESLPEGALVGTDSSRRRSQLALLRPDLRFEPVRGNVPTRLAKLDAGRYDALVLAVAGLARLGLLDRVVEVLEPERCLPAPGQGAIAVEAVSGSQWAVLAGAVDDPATNAEVRAERAFLAALGGGCQTPVGALARASAGRLRLLGVAVRDGRARRVEVEGQAEDPEGLGREAAAGIGLA